MAESNNRVRIDFDVNAEELKEITQAINILDKFNKQASQVTGALGTLTGSMNNNNKATKAQKDGYVNLDRAMDAWSNRLQANQSKMSSYEASQAKLTDKLKQYGRDVKVSVDETGKLAATFKNAEGNIVSMTGKYDKITNSIKEMKTNLSTASLEVKKKADADKKAVQEMDRLHQSALKVNKDIDEQARKYKELTRGTDLSRVLKANGNAFDVMNNSVKLNGQVVRGSIDRNGKFTQTIRDQDGTLRSISGYYDKVNKKLVQYSEAVSRSASNTRALGSAMDKSGRELTNLEKSMQGLNKYTLSWADAIEIAGTRMLQWNVASSVIFGLQNGFKALVGLLFQLDDQMTQLTRVLPDTTNFNEMMEDSIRLSTELGRTITDINEALITFARSGFNNVDTRFLSEAATLMANVSDINMDDAAESITSAITLFNVKARDSIQVVNKLNEVDNDYSVSTQQLAKSITRAGGTAQSFGVDLNELIGHTTAIGVATRESGQIIGNSLKSIYSRVNTLPKAQKAIEGLGIALTLPNGDNRRVADIMDDIAAKWPSLNNAEKQNTAIKVAGTYQLNRFLAMMNNYQMGLDATETAQHSYNSAVKENEKFMQSLTARLNLLKGSAQQLGMALGEAGLYKAIAVTLEVVNNFIQGAVKLVDVFGKWTFAIPLVIAALGTFVVVFQNIKKEMLTFQIAMATMNTTMSRSALAMSANVTTSAIFTTALGTMRTAVLSLTAAALTNPFTWIALAVAVIPMLIGHFQRLKAEQEALHKQAEDNVTAYKAFKAEIAKGDVSQTSLDTFTAKMDVAFAATNKLKDVQKTMKEEQAAMKNTMATSYDGGIYALQQYGDWQSRISEKTKKELADIGIKYDKYKTIEGLMGAVKKRQKEYSDTVDKGNGVLEAAKEKLMFHAEAFEEVGEEVKETMTIMELFFGVNDKMMGELVGSYNVIQVLTKVKEKDAAQTAALNQAIDVWTEKTGLSRKELLKNPAAMQKVIESQVEMADKWDEKTQKILSNEDAKQLAVDVTTQTVKNKAVEQVKAEKAAAEAKAKAAEEEGKRKGAAFAKFREEMEKSKTLGSGYTAEEITNNVLRSKSTKETADKNNKSLLSEDKKTKSTKNAYTDMKNLIVENNGKRKDSTSASAININKSLVSEDKQAKKTAKGHKDAATSVGKSSKDQKEAVIENSKKQSTEHRKQAMLETGNVAKSWGTMGDKIDGVWTWIQGLFGIKSTKKSKAGTKSGSLAGNGIDRYATGTNAGGHQGGPMIVGDGGKSELVHFPNGHMFLSPNKDTFVPNAPKGTSVLSGEKTSDVLAMINKTPKYANGVGPGPFPQGLKAEPWKWYQAVVSRFGKPRSYGGYSNRNVGGTNTKSQHAYGNAVDIFDSPSKMHAISRWLTSVPSIGSVIYNRQISTRGGAWRPYGGRGKSPHTDHVHMDFAKGGSSGGFLGNIASEAMDAMTKGASWLVDKGMSKFGVSNNLLPKGLADMNPVGQVKSMAVDATQKVIDNFTSSFDMGMEDPEHKHSGNASSWKPKIIQAAKRMNEPLTGSQLNGIVAQIDRESSGNEKAVQSPSVNDVNSRSGNFAKGLLQYIPQTFSSYSMSGYRNIFSGFDQLMAFFNNTTWEKDLPMGRSGWSPRGSRKYSGGSKGAREYANGGIINKPHLGLVGEAGPEAIIPLSSNKRSRAMELYEQTGQALGVRAYANGGMVGKMPSSYIVKWGDTLSELADKFNTSTYHLMQVNKSITSANKLKTGQKLNLSSLIRTEDGSYVSPSFYGKSTPKTTSEAPTSKVSTSTQKATYYTVKYGDTLSELAVKFKTSTSNLMKMNSQIKSANKIYKGQVLKIGTSTSTTSQPKTVYDGPSLSKTFKVGSRGNDVKDIQKVIGAAADGIFGPKTLAKLKDWQKKNKLKIDGIVNVDDLKKMFTKVIGAVQPKVYTAAEADARYQSTTDYMGYMEGMGAKGYDAGSYKGWKLRGIEDSMKYASKDTQRNYNTQMAGALSSYTDVAVAYQRFKEAEWYGLDTAQKKAVWEGIREDAVVNTVNKLNESTSKWLDDFNEGLSKASDKIADWVSLADSMKEKQASMKQDAYVDSYVTSGMDKYGMNPSKTVAETQEARLDEIKQKTEGLLTDNANIKYQNDPAEFAKRQALLNKEQASLQNKIITVTADSQKKGLRAAEYAEILKPLKDKLAELNAEEKALTDATTTNNAVFKTNEEAVAKLGAEYAQLQKELEETTKKTEILDKIKEKVTALFNWDANSLYTEKTDEFGNVVRDIEGTIRSVLDVQKAIQDITAGIYENIDKTVEEMITSILTTELPDIGSLFGAESDYSGIATGINGAIGTIKPTWDEALNYMSGSMMGMFSGADWQATMKEWTNNMAISMEGMQPLFENLMVKFPEVIAKVMGELPSLVYTAMQNLTVGVFNTVVEVLNRLVATVNQIVPAGNRAPLFDQMQYATPTYTQNNETNNEQKVYATGNVERNVTYIVNTGVAIASESELREFAMLLKDMMDEEEGRGKS